MDRAIKERLREVCSSYRAKSETFYFPLPRVKKFTSPTSPIENDINPPEGVLEAIKENKRIFVRIPRTFSGINLGVYLSYYLLRTQINDKQSLPVLIDGKQISPPQKGFNKNSPTYLKDEKVNSEFFEKIYIIEEPDFSSHTKTSYLISELKNSDNYVVILSKAEDKTGTIENFLTDTDTIEYSTTRISFSETAVFLEKTFDMQSYEAESLAMRLENTFRKFKIEVDPSYFALIQEDTLISLINANKRAELIQFAVQGLLSIIVACDPATTKLSRTTRERFLERICKYKIENNFLYIKDSDLAIIASDYINEFAYGVDQSEFLSPFFKSGLLYNFYGKVYFSYPYLESYLIARTLRGNDELAHKYFCPEMDTFDIYSFDLYCEMGPNKKVIDEVCSYADYYTNLANEVYGTQSVFDEKKLELNGIVNSVNLTEISDSINKIADKLQKVDRNKNVRVEKQRILDTQNHVISGLNQRKKDNDLDLEKSIQDEFYILDGLSRASMITLTLLGSGSESINKNDKQAIIKSCIDCTERLSNVWTINRLRIDFKKFKEEMLSKENIDKFINDSGIDDDMYYRIKRDIGVFISMMQTNIIMEPISRVMNNICSVAGVMVLSPIVSGYESEDKVKNVLKSVWLMEANPEEGYNFVKEVFGKYKGANMIRISSSCLLLNRLYWLHYQTKNSEYFSKAAKRIVSPIGISYDKKSLESAMKGPDMSI
ncbi:hypothetical protein [Acetobacter thailandicus]|uniref:hypothetical protein n=1 Tax=Acetobacter thailandicus TaxID=1502842 RepID=UPI001BA82399|nr:hypothetical protein [Acetobacter thailandicus]MBS1004674.1 hypothetical protein [Acetobacter thailandicus]